MERKEVLSGPWRRERLRSPSRVERGEQRGRALEFENSLGWFHTVRSTLSSVHRALISVGTNLKADRTFIEPIRPKLLSSVSVHQIDIGAISDRTNFKEIRRYQI